VVPIGVARGGVKEGQAPPKFLENIVILCFERRFFRQNSVIRLKNQAFWPPKFSPPNFWPGYATGSVTPRNKQPKKRDRNTTDNNIARMMVWWASSGWKVKQRHDDRWAGKASSILASQQVKEASSNTVGYPVSGQFLHKRWYLSFCCHQPRQMKLKRQEYCSQ